MKNQSEFGVPIQILHKDNAKECFSKSYKAFMIHNGIFHQSSCVDTPSHNGVAKWKNKHLLETIRVLLFQTKIPKQFWTEAISTTYFLINRMHFTVLDGDNPYNVLFPSKPLIPMKLRIFGCTCFVRDVRPHVTKLDPKSLKVCIFWGYSCLQKGYRCYSPDLKKYLGFTDVTFSNQVSFFSKETP
ncbi:gag-pol polyprotein [Gossypium australe]|uniref:Gag-pol polyprotein n=1 Tax=Gossypium australe TaxID=47621 RepID=A0A5B6VXR6_9ROSI|nr:gag-pol polyprotein [Gossypium australe]